MECEICGRPIIHGDTARNMPYLVCCLDHLNLLRRIEPRRGRPARPVLDPRDCGRCGTEFTPRYQTTRFCSPECRLREAIGRATVKASHAEEILRRLDATIVWRACPSRPGDHNPIVYRPTCVRHGPTTTSPGP